MLSEHKWIFDLNKTCLVHFQIYLEVTIYCKLYSLEILFMKYFVNFNRYVLCIFITLFDFLGQYNFHR